MSAIQTSSRGGQRVDLSLYRSSCACVLIDLLHGIEVYSIGAAHGGQTDLIFT